MARMFTRELTEEVVTICNGDAEHLDKAKLLNGAFVLVAHDTPDSTDVCLLYKFTNGHIDSYEFEEEDAPSSFRDRTFRPMVDGLARVSASYETFVKLDKGEIEVADALSSSDYKIDGNMMMLMPLMQAMESFSGKVRALAKEY
jgi:hypothetical protein